MHPRVEIVNTSTGKDFPAAAAAFLTASSMPPQQGTSILATVMLFISLLRIISVNFSE